MPVPAALARARFPEPILEVLRRLGQAGHRSWLVGGAVRDLLLQRPRAAADFDVATPARPEEVTALFPKVIPTGVEHGTVTVLFGKDKVEVTTFRGEGAYVDGRRPESVTFHGDLEADLARRDFTMNAMAYDPLAHDFRDPFGGVADMRRRLIRAVGDPTSRFGEDGLRAMRAVRFAAQLGYALHPTTRASIPGALPVVRKVSVERLAEELSRLVVALHADDGVALLHATGLLDVVLPDLARLSHVDLAHAIAILRRVGPDLALRFAALLHLLPPTTAERILLDLRLPRRLAEEVAALLRAHACLRAGDTAALPATPARIRRWLSGAGIARAPALLELAEAEARDLPAAPARRARAAVAELAREVEDIRRARPPLTASELSLDGRAVMQILGNGPGPHVGEALRHLLDRVLEDPARNGRDRLEEELRRWWEGRRQRL